MCFLSRSLRAMPPEPFDLGSLDASCFKIKRTHRMIPSAYADTKLVLQCPLFVEWHLLLDHRQGHDINLSENAFLDSGTSNMLAPTAADAMAIYSQISPNITLPFPVDFDSWPTICYPLSGRSALRFFHNKKVFCRRRNKDT